ncbi:hypothetical protein MD26_13350 [Pseudomonas sp. H2]|nr:hypothetical protein MD26_13350 [Pseudomonas sp. H2]
MVDAFLLAMTKQVLTFNAGYVADKPLRLCLSTAWELILSGNASSCRCGLKALFAALGELSYVVEIVPPISPVFTPPVTQRLVNPLWVAVVAEVPRMLPGLCLQVAGLAKRQLALPSRKVNRYLLGELRQN